MKKRRYTQRQQKLVKLISDNLGNQGFTRTMVDMMLESGYSKKTAYEQTEILRGIKDKVEPIVAKLITERDRAIEAMKGKIGQAKYRDLADATDKLIKNIQLLSGKETDKSEMTIKWEK